MRSMMPRSPFSRSPRPTQESSFPSHSHSQSSSVPASNNNRTTSPAEWRRSQRMSTEFRGMQRLEIRRGMEESHFLASRARAHNYNPPVDLRSLDYVSTYDTNLMCPICRCPFIDPVVLTECDHCFCRDCIRQAWDSETSYTPLGTRGDCPACRTPAKLGPRSATSKILVNLTDELIVKCPKADDGCKAELKRGEVQDHMNIYCGHALVECTDEKCEQPVRRKDAASGCLHFPVSCLACRKETQIWRLESHWARKCPDRKIHCELCNSTVFQRDFEEHSKQTCPAISTPCPGEMFGCTNRSRGAQADLHAKACPIAKLAPVLAKQQEQLEQHETAQKQMARKLELFENGFANMRSILSPSRNSGIERQSTDSAGLGIFTSPRNSALSLPSDFDSTRIPGALERTPSTFSMDQEATTMGSSPLLSRTLSTPPAVPGPRPTDLPEPYSADFNLDASTPFPQPAGEGGPYASPLHHLLSLHENLREELSRLSAALSDLDGRHSMQILNENLRVREEITYLGAQIGGLQRQVHWLTSTQLQRQQSGRSADPGSVASGSAAGTDGIAGSSVEAAVNAVSTAATALRGAARMVNVGGREGDGLRRRTSEEGRTKL